MNRKCETEVRFTNARSTEAIVVVGVSRRNAYVRLVFEDGHLGFPGRKIIMIDCIEGVVAMVSMSFLSGPHPICVVDDIDDPALRLHHL